MELDILPDNSIPLFSPEIAAPFNPSESFPTQIDESRLVIDGLPLETSMIKPQNIAEGPLRSEENATPLFQRRATSQQTSSSMSSKTGTISGEPPLFLNPPRISKY